MNLEIVIELACASLELDVLTTMNLIIAENVWIVEIGEGKYLEIEVMLVTQPSAPALIQLRQPLHRVASGP